MLHAWNGLCCFQHDPRYSQPELRTKVWERKQLSDPGSVVRRRTAKTAGTAVIHCNAVHKTDTPLLAAVAGKGNAKQEVPFHIPGHKRGMSVLPEFREVMASPLRHDLTELPGADHLSILNVSHS